VTLILALYRKHGHLRSIRVPISSYLLPRLFQLVVLVGGRAEQDCNNANCGQECLLTLSFQPLPASHSCHHGLGGLTANFLNPFYFIRATIDPAMIHIRSLRFCHDIVKI
jgi:hypothetical protein